jgi:hypothetical protein
MKFVCWECGKVLKAKDTYIFYDWYMCQRCFERAAYE